MDTNGDLLKGVVNKLQSVIDKEEASNPTSNDQICLPLNRRSSQESEDQTSTITPLSRVSSGTRLPSYPSSNCPSRPESSPDAPTASNNPCSNWSKVRNCLDKIVHQDQRPTESEKPARRKIFKKKVSKRVLSDSHSTSETFESLSTSDQSPEPKKPLKELFGNIRDPAIAEYQTPIMKRKRSLEGYQPSRKIRRFNSLDESLAIMNKFLPKHDKCQIEKRTSPGTVQSSGDVVNRQKNKPLKRRNSMNENSQP